MYHIDTTTQKYIIWYQNNIKNHHITNPNQQFSLYWCPHWNTMGISTPWNLMIQIRLFWITSDITWYTIIILGLWCIICSSIIIYAYNCNNICNCKVTLTPLYMCEYYPIRWTHTYMKSKNDLNGKLKKIIDVLTWTYPDWNSSTAQQMLW